MDDRRTSERPRLNALIASHLVKTSQPTESSLDSSECNSLDLASVKVHTPPPSEG